MVKMRQVCRNFEAIQTHSKCSLFAQLCQSNNGYQNAQIGVVSIKHLRTVPVARTISYWLRQRRPEILFRQLASSNSTAYSGVLISQSMI